MDRAWLFLAFLMSTGVPALAGTAPVLYFSDLEGGPNTGGENNRGVWVTVYGNRFGASRGDAYVTIGMGRAAAYASWAETKVVFQIGAAATSGNIVLTRGAAASNGIPFQVRGGKIYFVAVDGSDGNKGSFESPWRSLIQARNQMQPGDVTYARNGVSQTETDDWAASMLLRTQWCSSGLPRAIVAYPGATVTLGSAQGAYYGLRGADTSGGACQGGWVFAGLRMRGSVGAATIMGPSTNWRFVGNDMSCPNGDGPTACFAASLASNVKFLGNHVHEAGKATASALYHGVYFSTDSNHVEMGWNTIENIRGCRGVQIHSTRLLPDTGYNQYDISIHDNVIHDTQCDGVVVATVDPSKGRVILFNNVIYNAGKGPNNPERTGNWSCVYVSGMTNAGTPGSGFVELDSNTMYNCGSFATPPYDGANSAVKYSGGNEALRLRLRNNLVYQVSGAPYYLGPAASLTGSNNLFHGSGAAPASLSESVSGDPKLAGPALGDFHLTAGSPARRAGVAAGVAQDREGNPRAPGAYDIGAHQYTPPSVAALRCLPEIIYTPGEAACTITLSEAAPEAGAEIPLVSSDARLTVPSTVAFAPGSQEAIIRAQAPAVTARASATVASGTEGTSQECRLWLLPPGSHTPVLLAVMHGASYTAGAVAPGEVVSLFGDNLGPSEGAGAHLGTDGRVSTELQGTRVWMNGITAPLLYVQGRQVNAVAPFALESAALASVEVQWGGERSNTVTLPVATAAPGVFTGDSSGFGQALAWHETGTLNTPSHPATRAGLLAFYATGLGQTEPAGMDGWPGREPYPQPVAQVSVSIGGYACEVLYAGAAPGIVAGVLQVNVRVPSMVEPGPAVPLVIYAGEAASRAGVTIAVESP
ncbi:MAG: right-handed parallel beta-helix repeat-containing protein [Acidobacteria bacterium]|nr:right-handed parallel beta-helix repeat-containing protein [Acidobacteriota bacterium]